MSLSTVGKPFKNIEGRFMRVLPICRGETFKSSKTEGESLRIFMIVPRVCVYARVDSMCLDIHRNGGFLEKSARPQKRKEERKGERRDR